MKMHWNCRGLGEGLGNPENRNTLILLVKNENQQWPLLEDTQMSKESYKFNVGDKQIMWKQKLKDCLAD